MDLGEQISIDFGSLPFIEKMVGVFHVFDCKKPRSVILESI